MCIPCWMAKTASWKRIGTCKEGGRSEAVAKNALIYRKKPFLYTIAVVVDFTLVAGCIVRVKITRYHPCPSYLYADAQLILEKYPI